MRIREQDWMKAIKWIFAVFVVGVFLCFLLGETVLPADAPGRDYHFEEFVAQWEWVKPDGTRIPVDIPGKCDVKRNEVVAIETTLPEDLESNTSICFRSSKQDMQIFVDGVLRQSYSTKETRISGKASAVAYVFLDIMPEDAGKTIRVETCTDSSYSGIFYAIYQGNRMGIWHHFFTQYGAELVIAFVTLLLGIISIVGSVALRMCYHRKIDLEYLGWGVLIAAVWLIANSVFRQLIFPNITTINDMTFFMIMLMPMPFLLYMNGIQKGRYQKLYVFTEAIAVVDFLICTILHLTGQKDFADTIVYMAGVCFLAILLMGITIVVDVWKKQIKEYRLVALGMLGALLAASLQIIMYFRKSSLFNGVVMTLGLLFLLIFSVINTIYEILHMENDKQQAIMASQSKARFLANMSHEIRTPINAILGMDAMILRECRDVQLKEYALDIQNAGQSLLSLINEILDLSKIESGKMEIIPVEYDFSSVIHDIVNMISLKAADKDLEVQVYVDQELPSRLYGDEVRIRQILLNLLNNAVKYTEEGWVRLTVSGRTEGNTAWLTFTVEDTGIGIKEEDTTRLFAEYERIEERRNRNIEGTGLGMNITHTLLEMMGSHLLVESVYGQGSVFSFELEQGIVDHEPIGNLEERIRLQTLEYTYNVSFMAPEADILVVDDNGINRRVFRNLLKETKVRIDEAESGVQCLEMILEKHYDLIFLDHMMPEMDGVETLHNMREMEEYPCKDTPVIALTANAISGAREMYLAEGFDAFLSKPIVPDKLEKMIQDMLPEELLEYCKYELYSEKDGEAEKKKLDSRCCEPNNGGGKRADNTESDEETVTDLPVIEGIDWQYALLHLPGIPLLRDTVESFYRSMDSEADYLEDCYNKLSEDSTEQNVLTAYRIKVHAMKSSAALIGAVSLSGIAKILEEAAGEENILLIQNLTPAFLEEWRSYKEKLNICVKTQEEKKSIEDKDVILAYLEMLRVAMEDMDLNVADQTMEELRRYDYPEDIQEDMDQLSVEVENLDQERVAERIQKIMSSIR